MNETPTGVFITFEGPEGSGKSTQIRMLEEALSAKELPVLATREPGGTVIGNRIREIVLDPQHTEMSPRAEALLYSAARAQLVDQVIQPALDEGKIVLCDRYADSTIAYQGYGHGRSIDVLRQLGDYATAGLAPHMTLYLDIQPADGLQRKQSGAAEEWNRFEQRALDYHLAVHRGYLEMTAADPDRWRVIDASQDAETIHKQILLQVSEIVLNS